jgi:hypothetical protein
MRRGRVCEPHMVAGMMRPGTADADRKRARVMADRLLFD